MLSVHHFWPTRVAALHYTSMAILLMLSHLLTRRNLQQGEASDSGSHTSQRARGEQGR